MKEDFMYPRDMYFDPDYQNGYEYDVLPMASDKMWYQEKIEKIVSRMERLTIFSIFSRLPEWL